MAELAVAAAILQVAGAGVKLSWVLYEFGSTVSSSREHLNFIAKNVTLYSGVLKTLGQRLSEENPIHSEEALELARQLQDQSHLLFLRIEKLLPKTSRDSHFISLGQSIAWALKKSKADYLVGQLECLKSTVSLLVTILYAGRAMRSYRLEPTIELQDEINVEWMQARNLVLERQEAEERLSQLETAVQQQDLTTSFDDASQDPSKGRPTVLELVAQPQQQTLALIDKNAPQISDTTSRTMMLEKSSTWLELLLDHWTTLKDVPECAEPPSPKQRLERSQSRTSEIEKQHLPPSVSLRNSSSTFTLSDDDCIQSSFSKGATSPHSLDVNGESLSQAESSWLNKHKMEIGRLESLHQQLYSAGLGASPLVQPSPNINTESVLSKMASTIKRLKHQIEQYQQINFSTNPFEESDSPSRNVARCGTDRNNENAKNREKMPSLQGRPRKEASHSSNSSKSAVRDELLENTDLDFRRHSSTSSTSNDVPKNSIWGSFVSFGRRSHPSSTPSDSPEDSLRNLDRHSRRSSTASVLPEDSPRILNHRSSTSSTFTTSRSNKRHLAPKKITPVKASRKETEPIGRATIDSAVEQPTFGMRRAHSSTSAHLRSGEPIQGDHSSAAAAATPGKVGEHDRFFELQQRRAEKVIDDYNNGQVVNPDELQRARNFLGADEEVH